MVGTTSTFSMFLSILEEVNRNPAKERVDTDIQPRPPGLELLLLLGFLTVLVQMQLRRPSTHIGDGAHDRQPIGQLLLVLVVVVLQQGFSHLLPERISQRRV